VWTAGDTDDADFAPIVGWLRASAKCEFVALAAPSPDSAALSPDSEAIPQAIVLFQARPGSIRQSDVERLHCLAPLARLIVVAGPWCEGELRSGRPIQGVTRILWHQWKLQLPLELGISPPRAAASRPRTLTPADRLLQTLASGVPGKKHHGQAAVFTTRRDRFEVLADLCSAAGLHPQLRAPGLPPTEDASMWLVDGWEAMPAECCLGRSRPPTVLILDWPRADDVDQAAQHGIRHTLAQPFLVTDFLAAIDQILPGRIDFVAAHPAA
jgi:hypothetical protein